MWSLNTFPKGRSSKFTCESFDAFVRVTLISLTVVMVTRLSTRGGLRVKLLYDNDLSSRGAHLIVPQFDLLI